MNLNHLAVFHAVAQTGSMTVGAQRLDISQPAVSKQVQELEHALGVHLFDRVGRRGDEECDGRCRQDPATGLVAVEPQQAAAAAADQ